MAYFVLFTASGEQWILLLNSPAKLGMVGKMAVFLSVKHELGNSINSGTKTHAKGDFKLQNKRMFEEKMHNEQAFET